MIRNRTGGLFKERKRDKMVFVLSWNIVYYLGEFQANSVIIRVLIIDEILHT